MPLTASLVLAMTVGPRADDSIPLAWPSGPMEVRVALAGPIGSDEADDAVGRPIDFRPPGGTGADPPIGTLRIAGARLEDEGRTLVLLTDPHPAEASYASELPGGLGPLRYDLSGVEATWTAEGGAEPGWAGWLPDLDLDRSRDLTRGSAEHDRAFDLLGTPGTLTLRTLVALPEGQIPLAVEADRSFEAEVAFLPLDVGPGHEAEGVVDSFGEPSELFLTIPTGPGPGAESDRGFPSLRVSFTPAEGEPARPITRSDQILPWAPAPPAGSAAVPPLPDALEGGDATRGEAVFFAEKGKCSACHRVGDRGGEVGPDLTGIGDRQDRAALYHAIEAPSAAIEPAYLPYTVAMADGRVFSGVVRADGGDRIRVLDADAKAVELDRAEVEEIRPVSTSIMPVGLVGALGEEDLRDLLAYLSGLRGG
ncbi:c-type cytochrome [Tautonia plasticadhaerens]|uniref:Cytochrome c n=1 Tax=Tautonia plasticadhaerens TaxID=2527974 RepID=A0A518GY97_9BACT|nr:c-type cytochrome [Tautonia plasticadhaerens]QDV33560.1 Cytochrome c [Tautonia plasticadhaerens]